MAGPEQSANISVSSSRFTLRHSRRVKNVPSSLPRVSQVLLSPLAPLKSTPKIVVTNRPHVGQLRSGRVGTYTVFPLPVFINDASIPALSPPAWGSIVLNVLQTKF